ncbi:hypothetical protein AB1Y20_008483 [Prymnesium parvum]|uniref:Amino acid transporter transmembrane domain-containing protein n=1 Tax=Prymnesium parvum TaxID=97485 RepID=A0AB34IT51_PRYPA
MACAAIAHGIELTESHRSQEERSPQNGSATSTLLSTPELDVAAPPLQLARLRRAPAWGVTCNNIAFMAVPRSIPACFAATGWTIGLVCLVFSAVVTFDTGNILGAVCTDHPSLTSFPLLVGEACAARAARLGRDVKRWRAVGRTTTSVLQFLTYFLTGVAELIYFEQFFGQLFDTSPLCQWQWLLIVAAICLPAMQVPTFHDMRWAALWLGIAPLVVNVAVFFYEVLLVRPWACTPGPTFGEKDPQSVFLGVSAFAYAFGGHGLYPEEIREMADPSQWGYVMQLTYGVVIPLYFSVGLLGYAAYGDFAKSNINLNFPHNLMNVVSLGLQLVQEVFFVLDSNLVLLLAIELRLGVDPSQSWSPRWHGVPPVVARLLLRTGFLAVQVLVAQMLLSGEGDTLLSLQALIGAIGMNAFTYFIPYMLQAELCTTPLPLWRKCWGGTNILLGVLLMLTGLWSSTADLVQASPGLFAGECKLPYTYSPRSDSDPCNISGVPDGLWKLN